MDDDLYDDRWPEREPERPEASGDAEDALPESPRPEEPLAEPVREEAEPAEPRYDSLWAAGPSDEERELVFEPGEGEEAYSAAAQDAGPDEVLEHPEVSHVSHVGEDVVLLGESQDTAEQGAILSTDGSVLAAAPAEAEMSALVDLGPERRGNAWVWVGLVTGILLVAGALGYAWWYFNLRPIQVPNVVGRLPAQAAQALNDAGLRLGKVTDVPTDTAPAGTVVQQFPESDTKGKPGDAVSLVLAASPEKSKVPSAVGVSLSEASRVLANARLSPQVVESYSPTTPVGFVQSQAPSSGVEIEPGSVVALMVSKGTAPASFRVPKVIGLPETDAAALLGTIQVRAEAYRSFENSQPAGTVVAQTPLPDTQVPFDGVVLYLVSKGSGVSGVTVPDVVGQTSDRATKRLKTADLKAKLTYQTSSQAPKGEVIAQIPLARSKTAAGETIGLVVSAGPSVIATVPEIGGQTADEASKNLVAAGYRAVKFEATTTSQSAGRVYLQLPAAGTPWPASYPVMMLLAAP